MIHHSLDYKDKLYALCKAFLPAIILMIAWERVDWETIGWRIRDAENGTALWFCMAVVTEATE
jgi:MFS superfamily sulfate permease-like transporter